MVVKKINKWRLAFLIFSNLAIAVQMIGAARAYRSGQASLMCDCFMVALLIVLYGVEVLRHASTHNRLIEYACKGKVVALIAESALNASKHFTLALNKIEEGMSPDAAQHLARITLSRCQEILDLEGRLGGPQQEAKSSDGEPAADRDGERG